MTQIVHLSGAASRILYLLVITALLVGATLIGSGRPAEAATYEICNYSGSDDRIHIYRIASPFSEWNVSPGNCATVNNSGGAARVDVDPSGNVDIDSYRKWRASDNPYSEPCVVSENGASNPFNDEDNMYWTSRYSNCS